MIHECRADSIENINGNTALDIHIKERGIQKTDIVSVKHWQSASGEYRFSIVTKADVGINEESIFSQVNDLISKHSPDYTELIRTQNEKGNKNLLVINPADIHIGKYSAEKETGEAYNSEIAVKRVIDGIHGLLEKSKGFEIEKILFCIGNDVLHTDTPYSTTCKGTYVDSAGKWWEHFEVALELYIKCVEILRKIAPVDCIHSLSNHDYQAGFHLAQALKAWFRKADDISVEVSPAHRSYYTYGENLIGLEHGDSAKIDRLPLLMAQERSKEWSATKFRYWYLHHIHHKVKHKWLDGKDFIGVSVEYLRSPSSSDSWHSRKGFTGINKAVEAFIHSKKEGQIARITHYF